MDLQRFYGTDVVRQWSDIASLRLQVFLEYPYMYEGTMAEEEAYGAVFGRSPDSLAVIAYDGEQAVGASTCMPLVWQQEAFQKPLRDFGMRPEEYFYFAESVLLKPYRGQGMGHRFFHERESQARQCGFRHVCFCAIEREGPMPPTYRPLNEFWMSRGYVRQPELRTTYTWKDVGASEPTPKTMVYWTKTF